MLNCLGRVALERPGWSCVNQRCQQPAYASHDTQRSSVRQRSIAAAALALALVGGRAWHRPRNKSVHGRRCQHIRRCAIIEDNDHIGAVKRWLDDFIINMNFCPWAGPAAKEGHIRVVTSSATSEEGVLQDLKTEALALPTEAEPHPGQAVTTLLVCPYVSQWADFNEFHAFFVEFLEDGYRFADDLNLRVVAYHPRYALYGMSVSEGDRVIIQDPDGTQLSATVLSEAAGLDAEGEDLLEVKLDDTEDEAGGVWLVRYSAIVDVLDEDRDTQQDASAYCTNYVFRAPRPLLHLLRGQDLERAGEAGEKGHGPEIQAVVERNERMVRDIGADGMTKFLQRCG